MVNQFLATLDGIAAQPSGIVWPTEAVDAESSILRTALFGAVSSRQHNFLKALQLLMIVEESSLINEVMADDPRVTYTREQVVAILSAYGAAVQSVGATTTSILNFQVLPSVEYAYYDIYTTDGLTYRVSNSNGVRTTTVSFNGAGVSGSIATPDLGVALLVTNGQPAANSAWAASYWNPKLPLATTLARELDLTSIRQSVRSDLLGLYDSAPTKMEKIAAAVVSLGRP
jgi:hypothetical protein